MSLSSGCNARWCVRFNPRANSAVIMACGRRSFEKEEKASMPANTDPEVVAAVAAVAAEIFSENIPIDIASAALRKSKRTLKRWAAERNFPINKFGSVETVPLGELKAVMFGGDTPAPARKPGRPSKSKAAA